MGYRSRVCIRTTPAGFDVIDGAVRGANQSYGVEGSCDSVSTVGDVVTLTWLEVKWEPGTYVDVEAVEHALANDMGDEPWCLARVGEDIDDREVFTSDNLLDGGMPRYMLYIDAYIEGFDGKVLAPSLHHEGDMAAPLDSMGRPCMPGDLVKYPREDAAFRVLSVDGSNVYYDIDGGSIPTSVALAYAVEHVMDVEELARSFAGLWRYADEDARRFLAERFVAELSLIPERGAR